MTASRLPVRLTPRASHDEVSGFEGGVLRVRVKAPPVGGRANEALLRLLAEALDVPRSGVGLLRGHSSRDKLVVVEGLEEAEVRKRLESRASNLELRG